MVYKATNRPIFYQLYWWIW